MSKRLTAATDCPQIKIVKYEPLLTNTVEIVQHGFICLILCLSSDLKALFGEFFRI
jgi:hypothetical protein